MKLGAIDFLTKPITPEALRRVVAEVIARARTSPPMSRARAEPGPKPPIAPSCWRSIWQGPSERSTAASSARPKPCFRKSSHIEPESTEAASFLKRLQKLKERRGSGLVPDPP